ncbi:transcriptional regulator, LytTR family [Rhizobiales bacterium GAS188]|nr:transcriptional regulator, LytTR family [Rhizobiales bacterium GAS188]
MAVSKNSIEIAAAPSVETTGDDPPAAGDEQQAPVTSGAFRGTSSGLFLAYGGVVLVIAAFWLVNSFSTAHEAARLGGAYDLGKRMFFEGTSAVATLILLPLMRRGVAMVRTATSLPMQAARVAIVGVLFSLAHIFGMVALRKLAYGAMGAAYDFHLAAELPYEFRKDILSALLIGLPFWFLDRPATAGQAPSDAAVPRNSTKAGEDRSPHLWLRDGATSIRIDARDIVWVASAGNYVEFSLAAKRHLIRGTLAGEEARLLPFGLVRVHRTRLANLNHVVAVEPRPSGDFALRMDTGEVLIGSRRYKDRVAGLRAAATGSEAPQAG